MPRTNAIPEYSEADLKAMSAEQQYDARRNLVKQKEFVDFFKDSEAILDQNIFVGQIASASTTDQYPKVEAVLSPQNKLVKHYFFSAGRIDIRYDADKKQHHVEVVGSIPGRVSVILKRRTDSGRIVDGAYDIIEFQDGQTVFYAHSSKGNLAIENIEAVKRAADRAEITLAIPDPAKIGKPREVEQEESKQTAEKMPISPPIQKEKETTKEQALAAPAAPKISATESPKDFSETPKIKTEAEVTLPSSPTEKPTSQQPKPETTAAQGLRQQLEDSIKERASQRTINYLVQQIAKTENKDVQEINKEFDIGSNVVEQKIVETPKVIKSVEKETVEPEVVKERPSPIVKQRKANIEPFVPKNEKVIATQVGMDEENKGVLGRLQKLESTQKLLKDNQLEIFDVVDEITDATDEIEERVETIEEKAERRKAILRNRAKEIEKSMQTKKADEEKE
jgi:hypothetical protein